MDDLPTVGAQLTTDQVEEGRLACAIRADDGGKGTVCEAQADALHCMHSAEGFRKVAYFKHEHSPEGHEPHRRCARMVQPANQHRRVGLFR